MCEQKSFAIEAYEDCEDIYIKLPKKFNTRLYDGDLLLMGNCAVTVSIGDKIISLEANGVVK